MADTLVKKPKLIVGTQSQVEAEMGDNDIGFATDIEFYNKAEIDEQYTSIITYVGDKDREIKSDITQLDTNIRTVGDWVNAKDESGNRATLTTEAQDAYRAINELNAKIGEGGGGASLPILMAMWSDHVINDMSWLRADTFSWQSGDVYKAAYEHLVGDLAGLAGTQYYAWTRTVDGGVYYTISASPDTGWAIFYKDSSGDMIRSGYVMEGGSQTIYNDGGDELTRDSSKDETVPQKQTDTIGDITISYYLAQDGHKICLPDQESNLIALYEATGVAWYFILDTDNKQFKLPREDKDGQYLYFYVGNFTQEAIEQTAGLNAELFNGKADVDLNNINPSNSAKATIVGWGMPDYDSGVSINNNTNYTCPTDGFLIATGYSSNSGASNMLLNGSEFIRGIYNTTQYTYTPFVLPVRKNDVVRVQFTGATVGQGIMFYPYKGAQND